MRTESESTLEAVKAGERLIASGRIGLVSVLWRAIEQRLWVEQMHQFLSNAFPDLSLLRRERRVLPGTSNAAAKLRKKAEAVMTVSASSTSCSSLVSPS